MENTKYLIRVDEKGVWFVTENPCIVSPVGNAKRKVDLSDNLGISIDEIDKKDDYSEKQVRQTTYLEKRTIYRH